MRSLTALLLLVALPAPALACTFARGEVHEANLYYELGSSALGMSGDETLKVMAANFIGCDVIYIASGHLDASELESNPTLGQARVEDARKRLQAQGIPARNILVRDMKFDSPAQPTAANVREPFNRRVELVVVIR
jgi:outer membrane protein OmpA-like peptidoglycan-associated protein